MRGMTRRQRRRNDEAGAELVELALTLPLILLALLCITDFGSLFQKQEIVANAAREGARLAARPSSSAIDVHNRVLAYVQASGLPTFPGSPTAVVTPTTLTSGANTWPATQVNVSYDHGYSFLRFVNFFGASFSTVTLRAQATMRTEINTP